jgi:integrase
MSMRLTDEGIKQLEAPAKGHKLIFDSHPDAPRGFGLRITAAGSKAFVLRYKAGGKDRLLTIGEYGKNAWRLAAARKQAGEYRQQVNTGADIVEQRRTDRAEKTFADVAEDYCAKHADRLKRGDQVRWVLDKHIVPTLGESKLSAIRRADIIDLVEGIAAKSPRVAALALLRIKQVMGYAEDRELIEVSVAATIKPSRVSRALTPRARGRVLDDAEIRAAWERIEACGMHKLTALAIKLMLVTGQRPGEVAGMRWEEVSGDTWTIPATRRGKTDTEHAVPLTGTALGLLAQAKTEAARLGKRRKKKPAGFVFEARPGMPISTNAVGRAVSRYAEALGNVDADTWGHWTPHDLRRTCRTGLAAEGIGDTVAEAVVGHTRKGIIGVYDRHRYDAEKRVALEAWERRLLRIAEGKKDAANVVPMVARVG